MMPHGLISSTICINFVQLFFGLGGYVWCRKMQRFEGGGFKKWILNGGIAPEDPIR